MSEDIFAVNRYQAFGYFLGFREKVVIEQSHAEAMKSVLISGIDFERLTVEFYGLVKVAFTEGIDSFFE